MLYMIIWWDIYIYISLSLYTGWWFQPTPLKNHGLRQLGWWNSQNIWESHSEFHGSKPPTQIIKNKGLNHQPQRNGRGPSWSATHHGWWSQNCWSLPQKELQEIFQTDSRKMWIYHWNNKQTHLQQIQKTRKIMHLDTNEFVKHAKEIPSKPAQSIKSKSLKSQAIFNNPLLEILEKKCLIFDILKADIKLFRSIPLFPYVSEFQMAKT